MKASSTRTEPKTRSARGFTLVEILVVIAILAVLAALVVVAANKARDAAHNAQCVSSLRQLANVVFLDGHVEGLRLEEVPTNTAHPFWSARSTDPNAPKHR